MLEAFLQDHPNLIPSAQRRAEAASYTPGEDLLGRPDAQNSRARHESSRTPLGERPWGPVLRRSGVLSGGNPDEDVEEIPRLPPRRSRAAVTPSVSWQSPSSQRDFTPCATTIPFPRTPALTNSVGQYQRHTYRSDQPITVNNYHINNNYCNQTPSHCCPPNFPSASTVVNGAVLDAETLMSLHAMGVHPTPGSSYWYDSKSGLWGYQGGPYVDIIQAGLFLGGPLRPNASGTPFTRIYANGRELPQQDIAGLRNAGINPMAGQRFWVNADGSCGLEGSPIPWGNVFAGTGFGRASVGLGAILGGLVFGNFR